MRRRLLPIILLLCVPPLAFALALVVVSLPPPPRMLQPLFPSLVAPFLYLAFYFRWVSLVTWPLAAVLLGWGWKVFSTRTKAYAAGTVAVAAVPVWIIIDVGF